MQEGKRFKVVAADARPHLEGKVLRQRLIKRGIACTYILLSGVACIIGVTSIHKNSPTLMHAIAYFGCPILSAVGYKSGHSATSFCGACELKGTMKQTVIAVS